MSVGSIVILGGRSEIGLEVATRLAPGRTVVLAARRSGDLEDERRAVLAAGAASVETVEFDADHLADHGRVLSEIVELGPIDVVVLAFGILGDQARAETDAQHAVNVIHTDFVAQVGVLTHLAQLLRAQGSGRIVVFSSIAGARVRRANYVYGSAKAGLDGFASGLGDALAGSGVSLLLVRPGFVIGQMTEGMTPAPMASTPGQVADAVVKALRRGRERVWVPGMLRLAIVVMRLLPQRIWRRMPR
ncbi:SDR family NAD(P)-dependent oxidoreductase [Rhodococcus maanshanensis]|uniref:Short-chain dehydrogenase n=1 Tax=Rhodococcus maanshanensis TaxID=183556 RepID=A0A1H7LGE0_9NOCA|nr:SDR family NAD(P)-dependent oxidoreductase [Rhodococcus maanshanensis]SEK97993.1 Short-chain dehydrogenase [Rhodococcus maanshanensis]